MYVIGLDIGTTSTKAIVVDQLGAIRGSGQKAYKLIANGACIEQDAEEWWEAAKTAVSMALNGLQASDVRGISVSTQGATMVTVDEKGNPLGNAITWLDQRALNEVKYIRKTLSDEYIYKTTGWKLAPSMDAAKITYLKWKNQYPQSYKYLSTLEFINYKLVGRMVIDPTNAGIRQLFNIHTGEWDEKILNVINCSENELPEICETGEYLGNLTERAANELGLSKSVKVYNGAHDQYCASLGSGSIHPGDMFISTGTTWAVMGISERPLLTNTFLAACPHPIKGFFGNMASLGGAGVSYQWMKDSVLGGESFDEINVNCEKRIGKYFDLIFVPFLSGAVYPYWVQSAKGAFCGMKLEHDRYDMALSVMEAAAFSVKTTIEDFCANGQPVQCIKIMGGATKSKVWMGILKSVLGITIEKLGFTDVCALGAAAVALVSMGEFKNYNEIINATVDCEEVEDMGYPKTYFQEKYLHFIKRVHYELDYYKDKENDYIF